FDAIFVPKGYDQTLLRDLGLTRDIELAFVGSLNDQSWSCSFQDCDTPAGNVIIGLQSPFGGTNLTIPVTPGAIKPVADFREPVPGPSIDGWLPATTYSYEAAFDGNFNTGLGEFGSFEITPRPCQTTITQTVHQTTPGGAVTFSARVSTSVAPVSGYVVFYQGPPSDGLTLTGVIPVPAGNVVSSGPITALPSGATTTVTALFTSTNGNQATVQHIVASEPPPPTANDDFVTTPRGQAVTFAPFANDVSPTGDPLHIEELTGSGPGDLDFDDATGNYTYTPPPEFVGDASFQYRAGDDSGGISPQASITIIVTCAPTAVTDLYATDFEVAITVDLASNVLANDDTCDEAVTLLGQPDQGTVTDFDPFNGTFTYTPPAGFTGIATFTYAYTSGVVIDDVGTVLIAVGPAADDPDSTSTTANTAATTTTTTDGAATTTSPATSTTIDSGGASPTTTSGPDNPTPPTAPGDGVLPDTGSSPNTVLLLAGALLVAGALLRVRPARRTRS
ncbi:MAG TPA: Ig-like domain-containing protein, partial [Ilumatobacteraceae bacterium]|nr:Ig-like domain-containing protein [Ilumatobacteraceae bacterium]